MKNILLALLSITTITLADIDSKNISYSEVQSYINQQIKAHDEKIKQTQEDKQNESQDLKKEKKHYQLKKELTNAKKDAFISTKNLKADLIRKNISIAQATEQLKKLKRERQFYKKLSKIIEPSQIKIQKSKLETYSNSKIIITQAKLNQIYLNQIFQQLTQNNIKAKMYSLPLENINNITFIPVMKKDKDIEIEVGDNVSNYTLIKKNNNYYLVK